MQLTVTVGATVNAVIDGHSATNGASIPSGSKIAIVSNDPTVATVAAIPDLTADQQEITAPVTVLASGSTDLTVTVTTPDGTPFTDVATLIVAPAVPGLTHVTLTLVSA